MASRKSSTAAALSDISPLQVNPIGNEMLFLLHALTALKRRQTGVRFYRTTRDRFFLYFAISFGLEGICRMILGISVFTDEQEPFIYLLRLASYLLIFYAIICKNFSCGTGKKG